MSRKANCKPYSLSCGFLKSPYVLIHRVLNIRIPLKKTLFDELAKNPNVQITSLFSLPKYIPLTEGLLFPPFYT